MVSNRSGTAKRLWALEGGNITEQKGNLVVGETGDVVLPCPSFLVEHSRGLVLIDTGLVPAAATDARGVYGDLLDKQDISLRPEQCVDQQIEALGYKSTDVTHVLMSHLHWDHTGGMYLFPHAQFYIMSGELQYAYWPLPAAPLFRREDIEPTRGFAWNQIESAELDLFGDGSIVMIHMPGHTPGNSSFVVRLAGRTIVLAADTAHLRTGLARQIPMPSDHNSLQSVQSLRRLGLLVKSLDAMLWLSHDPEDWAEYKHAPYFYE
jgi:glyoxylase-like metal-dependent hydrolase (beta-lactamase superfamily II)